MRAIYWSHSLPLNHFCLIPSMKFLNPKDALKQFGIYGTQHVADLGSGSGHFSLAAAGRLDGGVLYAVDVDKEMLSRLVSEAGHHGHSNLHPIWGDLCKPKGVPLADECVDRAIAANVLFQVDDRNAFVQEIKRLLRPGGKVLLVEWKHSADGGPTENHKVSEDMALALFGRHGFVKEGDIDAGDFHYGMILKRES